MIDKFDDKVLQRVGTEASFIKTKDQHGDTTKLSDQIDFSKVATEGANDGYATPPPPWRRSPSDQGSGDSGGSGNGGIHNLNLGNG